jgi:hypothetical protein
VEGQNASPVNLIATPLLAFKTEVAQAPRIGTTVSDCGSLEISSGCMRGFNFDNYVVIDLGITGPVVQVTRTSSIEGKLTIFSTRTRSHD